MKKARCWIVLIFIVSALVNLHSLVFAIHHEDRRFSLQGLKEVLVHVSVFYSAPDRKPTWLNESRLRMDIETKLKMAGIKVLTCSEWLTTPRMPILRVDIRITHDEQYMCEAKIELDQNVYLEREPAVGTFFMTTWSTHVEWSDVSSINEKWIRVVVRRIADAFIEDYRFANSGEKDWQLYPFLCLGDVNTLIEKSNHKDPYIRGIAVWSLGQMQDSRSVEPLIARLKDEHREVRHLAAHALGIIKDPRAVEPLLGALKDENPGIRSAAVRVLGMIGDPRAVEPLIAALKDQNPDVRKGAAHALGEIKDPRAVEPLLGALKDENLGVRSGAAWALGWIKDHRAVEPLIESLKDESSDVRSEAARALGEIKDPRAVEPLIAALKDENYYGRSGAARALGWIKDPRAVEPLIESLKDESSDVRSEAAWALSWIGDPRAVEPLIAALKDGNSGVRSHAARALGKITGKDFEQDTLKWQKWWEENKEKLQSGR